MTSTGATLSMLKRIGLNVTWLGLARIVTQLQLAVFTVLAARGLGSARFGEYAWITSVVLIGNVFTTFGTDTLLIRDIARAPRENENERSAALLLQLLLSAGFILGVAAWSGLTMARSPETQAGLSLYALALLPLAFFSVYTAGLRGLERMDLYLLVNLLSVTLQTGGAWIILRLGGGLLPLLGWLVATQAAAAAAAGRLHRKTGYPGFSLAGLNVRLLKPLLLRAWPLGLISLLGILYQRMGVLVLASIGAPEHVGWYAAAARVTEALKLGHIAILGALLPALARMHVSGAEPGETRRALRGAFGLLACIALAAALAASFWAQPLTALLFGTGYAPSAPVLRLLAWSLVPYTLSACLSTWAVARGGERQVLQVTLAALLCSLVLTLSLVRAAGVTGAGWAALGSESVQAVLFLIWTQRTGRK